MAHLYSVGIETSSLQPQLINRIWNTLEMQLNSMNITGAMTIPVDIWNRLDAVAKNILQVRAIQRTGFDDMIYVRDGNHYARWLLVSEHKIADIPRAELIDDGSGVPALVIKQSPPEPSKAVKIPRPPNAYILYRKDNHEQVKKAYPGIHNNEISVIIGGQWKSETQAVRDRYVELAASIRARFHEQYPDYRYNPRRPSEVKRRAKRTRKAEPAQPVSGDIPSGRVVTVGELGDQQIEDLIAGQQFAANGVSPRFFLDSPPSSLESSVTLETNEMDLQNHDDIMASALMNMDDLDDGGFLAANALDW